MKSATGKAEGRSRPSEAQEVASAFGPPQIYLLFGHDLTLDAHDGQDVVKGSSEEVDVHLGVGSFRHDLRAQRRPTIWVS